MDIIWVLVFILGALIIRWIRLPKIMISLSLVLSALSIFWLQPLSSVRNLDFWFPTASIALTVLVWAFTYPGENRGTQYLIPGLVLLTGTILAVAALRYLGPACCLTKSTPPEIWYALGAVIGISLAGFAGLWLGRRFENLLIGLIILIIVMFVFLKSEDLSVSASSWLRGLSGQSKSLASAGDLPWLGFSFLAFRLLHVIRDRQANRLPVSSLSQFGAYALFFPAAIAGPIDRCQHFFSELNTAVSNQTEPDWKEKAIQDLGPGLFRVLVGGVKKFVVADSLALIALNAQNAGEIQETSWAWVALIAYSLRIYFDFSGYTDIALGTARLIGIHLPENFDRPYTRLNLTAFWNSWHITLAQWFRAYVFNPLTRFMRTRPHPLPMWLIILSGQMVTMALIGLWHGISWNFLIWGVWHGGGLFVQNRWSEWRRARQELETDEPVTRKAVIGASWLVTFLYVSLGWVWFVLPSTSLSWSYLLRLFGAGS